MSEIQDSSITAKGAILNARFYSEQEIVNILFGIKGKKTSRGYSSLFAQYDAVVDAVLSVTGLTKDEIFSKSRTSRIVTARMVMCLICKEVAWSSTWVSIGEYFGVFPGTVHNRAVSAMERIRISKEYKDTYERAKALLIESDSPKFSEGVKKDTSVQ